MHHEVYPPSKKNYILNAKYKMSPAFSFLVFLQDFIRENDQTVYDRIQH